MVEFKCVDCGGEVPCSKEEKELKVEFSNPGTVFVKAKVMECPKCKTHYSDSDDTGELFDKIEKEYNKKNE